MKLAFNLLLWTTHVTQEHFPLFAELKRSGYDGVEIPIFEGTPEHFRTVGAVAADQGLPVSAVTVLPGLPESAIAGVEAPLWTETLTNIREVEAMAYPRLAALAEVAWTPQAARAWDDFRERLGGQGPRFQALGLNFYRSPQIPWRP